MDRSLIKVANRNGISVQDAAFLVEEGLKKLSWQEAPAGLSPFLKRLYNSSRVERYADQAEALTKAYLEAERHGLITDGTINTTLNFGAKKQKGNDNRNNRNDNNRRGPSA